MTYVWVYFIYTLLFCQRQQVSIRQFTTCTTTIYLDQIVPSLTSSLNGSPRSDIDLGERFSRKVFVGGLPPDIDEGKINVLF